jgi:hypothetical protein
VELKDQTAIETGLFVRWVYDAPKFGKGVKGNAAFSNTTKTLQIDGFNYAPLDRVVNITSSTSSIRSSSDRVTITITGLNTPLPAPNNVVSSGADILKLLDRGEIRVPNSQIIIHRAFFDLETGALLDLPQNPIRRFTGFVNNFNLVESRDPLTNESVIAYQLNCVSYADFLGRKVSGRVTGGDWNEFDASGSLIGVDRIFQRTARLKGFTLNWGG